MCQAALLSPSCRLLVLLVSSSSVAARLPLCTRPFSSRLAFRSPPRRRKGGGESRGPQHRSRCHETVKEFRKTPRETTEPGYVCKRSLLRKGCGAQSMSLCCAAVPAPFSGQCRFTPPRRQGLAADLPPHQGKSRHAGSSPEKVTSTLFLRTSRLQALASSRQLFWLARSPADCSARRPSLSVVVALGRSSAAAGVPARSGGRQILFATRARREAQSQKAPSASAGVSTNLGVRSSRR